MLIKNATVLDEGFNFVRTGVKILNDTIVAIGDKLVDTETIDAQGLYLLPGFIDVHTHGCIECDTCDADIEKYEKMSRFYASKGVTSFLFTTMTLPERALSEILNRVAAFNRVERLTSYSHGVYLEGPFINPAKKGAQCSDYISPPDVEMFDRLCIESGNSIKIVTIAPEMKGSIDFIRKVSGKVRVALGHTKSDYDTALKAYENGASDTTHLFNGMPDFLHREPGVVGAAFDRGAFIEIICDGIHNHPSTVRLVFRLANKDKIVLISDSIRAAGMPDGEYMLGGQDVVMKGGKPTLKDGTLAGSACNLLQCVRNCIDFGIPMELAVKAATINPAKLIGVDGLVGSIKVGKRADLIMLNEGFELDKVFIKGHLIKKGEYEYD